MIVDNNNIPTQDELIRKVEACQLDDVVISIQTSGSQTKAKTALITKKNIIAHCQSFIQTIPIKTSSIWLNCMPLQHIAGIMIVYRCWFSKTTMILHNNFNEKKIWQTLQQNQVSHISLVPRMLLRLLDYQSSLSSEPINNIPSSLKYVLIGGDRLSESLYQRAITAGWPIYISYGMTEATSTIAIGQYIRQLKLLDGVSARVDHDGILQIKGDMMISDYGHKKALHNEWFESNDLALLEGDMLNILGRNDHLIIRSGEKIQAEFIEELLASIPAIEDIAIVKYREENMSDERGDSIAAIVCYQQKNNNIERITQWIKKNIKSSYQPKRLFKVDKIPRTALGKVKRRELELIVNAMLNHERVNQQSSQK